MLALLRPPYLLTREGLECSNVATAFRSNFAFILSAHVRKDDIAIMTLAWKEYAELGVSGILLCFVCTVLACVVLQILNGKPAFTTGFFLLYVVQCVSDTSEYFVVCLRRLPWGTNMMNIMLSVAFRTSSTTTSPSAPSSKACFHLKSCFWYGRTPYTSNAGYTPPSRSTATWS